MPTFFVWIQNSVEYDRRLKEHIFYLVYTGKFNAEFIMGLSYIDRHTYLDILTKQKEEEKKQLDSIKVNKPSKR